MGVGSRIDPERRKKLEACLEEFENAKARGQKPRLTKYGIARECGVQHQLVDAALREREQEREAGRRKPSLGVVATIAPSEAPSAPVPANLGLDPVQDPMGFVDADEVLFRIYCALQVSTALTDPLMGDTAKCKLIEQFPKVWGEARTARAASGSKRKLTTEELQAQVRTMVAKMPAAIAAAAADELRKRGVV